MSVSAPTSWHKMAPAATSGTTVHHRSLPLRRTDRSCAQGRRHFISVSTTGDSLSHSGRPSSSLASPLFRSSMSRVPSTSSPAAAAAALRAPVVSTADCADTGRRSVEATTRGSAPPAVSPCYQAAAVAAPFSSPLCLSASFSQHQTLPVRAGSISSTHTPPPPQLSPSSLTGAVPAVALEGAGRGGISENDQGSSRFPKLVDCAHFHYDTVQLGPLLVQLYSDEEEMLSVVDDTDNTVCTPSSPPSSPPPSPITTDEQRLQFCVQVTSSGRSWLLRRSYAGLRALDRLLHQCIYDRKFSCLPALPPLQPAHCRPCDGQPVVRESVRPLVADYLQQLSQLAGAEINCAPALCWLELDNRGNRLLAPHNSDINTPAVAAALVVKRCVSHAVDEISLEVGDMISVIDMSDSAACCGATSGEDDCQWWRGKRGFQVGFFPCRCVRVIDDHVACGDLLQTALVYGGGGGGNTGSGAGVVGAGGGGGHLDSSAERPVFRKRARLVDFFRNFIHTRPSRRRLKRCGILKERVFGCDLGEHLINFGLTIPIVLQCCAEYIEKHGIVDGIYRLSGVSSNIQKLRNTFDEGCVPDWSPTTTTTTVAAASSTGSHRTALSATPAAALITCSSTSSSASSWPFSTDNLGGAAAASLDVHSVSCLLKQYFRELPNPLLTFRLYDQFVTAVQADETSRLLCVRDVVQQLPPPHYRTLDYLIGHLYTLAQHAATTGMTAKNLAIVWAPNLVRSIELEGAMGVAALQGVGIQAVVVEFLIRYRQLIFSDKLPSFAEPSRCVDADGQSSSTPTTTPARASGHWRRDRPKSLAVSTPAKLLTLEEARSRALASAAAAAASSTQSTVATGSHSDQAYIDVGGGPSNLPVKYHTVIELPPPSCSTRRHRQQRKPSGGGPALANSAGSSGRTKRSPLVWTSLLFRRARAPLVGASSGSGADAAVSATLPLSGTTAVPVPAAETRPVSASDQRLDICVASPDSLAVLTSPSNSAAVAAAVGDSRCVYRTRQSVTALCRPQRFSGLDCLHSASCQPTAETSVAGDEHAAADKLGTGGVSRSVSLDSFFGNALCVRVPYCDASSDDDHDDASSLVGVPVGRTDVIGPMATVREAVSGNRHASTCALADCRDLCMLSEAETLRLDTMTLPDCGVMSAMPAQPRMSTSGGVGAGAGSVFHGTRVVRRASVETLTRSDSTGGDVSSLRQDEAALVATMSAASGRPVTRFQLSGRQSKDTELFGRSSTVEDNASRNVDDADAREDASGEEDTRTDAGIQDMSDLSEASPVTGALTRLRSLSSSVSSPASVCGSGGGAVSGVVAGRSSLSDGIEQLERKLYTDSPPLSCVVLAAANSAVVDRLAEPSAQQASNAGNSSPVYENIGVPLLLCDPGHAAPSESSSDNSRTHSISHSKPQIYPAARKRNADLRHNDHAIYENVSFGRTQCFEDAEDLCRRQVDVFRHQLEQVNQLVMQSPFTVSSVCDVSADNVDDDEDKEVGCSEEVEDRVREFDLRTEEIEAGATNDALKHENSNWGLSEVAYTRLCESCDVTPAVTPLEVSSAVCFDQMPSLALKVEDCVEEPTEAAASAACLFGDTILERIQSETSVDIDNVEGNIDNVASFSGVGCSRSPKNIVGIIDTSNMQSNMQFADVSHEVDESNDLQLDELSSDDTPVLMCDPPLISENDCASDIQFFPHVPFQSQWLSVGRVPSTDPCETPTEETVVEHVTLSSVICPSSRTVSSPAFVSPAPSVSSQSSTFCQINSPLSVLPCHPPVTVSSFSPAGSSPLSMHTTSSNVSDSVRTFGDSHAVLFDNNYISPDVSRFDVPQCQEVDTISVSNLSQDNAKTGNDSDGVDPIQSLDSPEEFPDLEDFTMAGLEPSCSCVRQGHDVIKCHHMADSCDDAEVISPTNDLQLPDKSNLTDDEHISNAIANSDLTSGEEDMSVAKPHDEQSPSDHFDESADVQCKSEADSCTDLTVTSSSDASVSAATAPELVESSSRRPDCRRRPGQRSASVRQLMSRFEQPPTPGDADVCAAASNRGRRVSLPDRAAPAVYTPRPFQRQLSQHKTPPVPDQYSACERSSASPPPLVSRRSMLPVNDQVQLTRVHSVSQSALGETKVVPVMQRSAPVVAKSVGDSAKRPPIPPPLVSHDITACQTVTSPIVSPTDGRQAVLGVDLSSVASRQRIERYKAERRSVIQRRLRTGTTTTTTGGDNDADTASTSMLVRCRLTASERRVCVEKQPNQLRRSMPVEIADRDGVYDAAQRFSSTNSTVSDPNGVSVCAKTRQIDGAGGRLDCRDVNARLAAARRRVASFSVSQRVGHTNDAKQ